MQARIVFLEDLLRDFLNGDATEDDILIGFADVDAHTTFQVVAAVLREQKEEPNVIPRRTRSALESRRSD